MSTVISVENLGKKYILRHQQREPYTALRDVLAKGMVAFGRRLRQPFRRNQETAQSQEEFWALNDVSFEVRQGDRIGIIGRNGAGKSTLLKILSRITEPTTGRVKIKGRVASLLEVGTGFHPELTGRENIYLNGAILGMSRVEIKKKFDEIVDFAEIERFLDTPVKRYSSGMYVRLAFAVAAHLEPEILVVDEVLAVGDLQFQKKCLGKMQDVGKDGKTVLFVSHNMEAVRKLCASGILLHQGKLLAAGTADAVIGEYLSGGYQSQAEFLLPAPAENLPGYAHKVTIENCSGMPANEIPIGQPWQIRVFVKVIEPIEHFIVGLGFFTELNTPLRTCWSTPQDIMPGEYEIVFKEKTLLLTSGIYPVVVGLSANERTFQYVENTVSLHVAEVSNGLDLVRIEGCGLILNQLDVEVSASQTH